VDAWNIEYFDMKTPASALNWFQRKAGEPKTLNDLGAGPPTHLSNRLTIRARFEAVTPILIRGRHPSPNAPEFVHFQEGGKAMLTGTSIAGVLRQRVRRIASVLQLPGAQSFDAELFGFVDPRKGGVASRVEVNDVELLHGGYAVQSRVAIDRFTQGSLETALFDEAPWFPTRLTDPQQYHCEIVCGIDLENAPPNAAPVLAGAFKDLWLGDLPIGGEVGAGRGILQGLSATFHYANWPELRWSRRAFPKSRFDSDPAAIEVTGWNRDWENLFQVKQQQQQAEESHSE
jgi:hypothetical protein